MVRLIVDGGFAISDRSLKTGKKGSLKGENRLIIYFLFHFFKDKLFFILVLFICVLNKCYLKEDGFCKIS
uniref:Uncharacterized protein n=1 Tax=Meloidogyne enterolobii TaxID=390850 RepID=A0A6V7W3F5_MELEN|nr:unnamed protein product [Meloidogyne enterolobii]